MYHIFITGSSADEHLGSFHLLSVVNKAATNVDVQACLLSDMESFGYVPRNGVAGLCDRSSLEFWELSAVIHSDCTSLYSH